MVSSPAAFPVIGWSPIPISSVPFSVRFAHAKAPWLHGHCPASSLLRASPTPRPLKRYLFLRCVPCPIFTEPAARVSPPAEPHFPCALPLSTPENSDAALKRLFTSDDWLQHIWKAGRSLMRNEAISGSRFLTTARRFAPRCFYTAIARRALRFATCRTFSWHGEHLSVHKLGWWVWVAPDGTDGRRLKTRRL